MNCLQSGRPTVERQTRDGGACLTRTGPSGYEPEMLLYNTAQWRRQDSNLPPEHSQCPALPDELRPQVPSNGVPPRADKLCRDQVSATPDTTVSPFAMRNLGGSFILASSSRLPLYYSEVESMVQSGLAPATLRPKVSNLESPESESGMLPITPGRNEMEALVGVEPIVSSVKLRGPTVER